LLRAVLFAELDPALALAPIHAGAGVPAAGALPLPLARVDAGAVDHVPAGLLIRARQHGTAEDQRRRRTRDEDPLGRSHSPSFIDARSLARRFDAAPAANDSTASAASYSTGLPHGQPPTLVVTPCFRRRAHPG